MHTLEEITRRLDEMRENLERLAEHKEVRSIVMATYKRWLSALKDADKTAYETYEQWFYDYRRTYRKPRSINTRVKSSHSYERD